MSAPLYAINHDAGGRLWCGLAVVAAVTGTPTRAIVDKIQDLRGRPTDALGRAKPVEVIFPHEIKACLKAFGCEIVVVEVFSKPMPTFCQWRRSRGPGRDYAVVLVTGHYVAVSGRRFVDSRYRDWISPSDWPHQRARVRCVIYAKRAA